MTRYAVHATVDVIIELEAATSQDACDRIAEAFKLTRPTDPLANTKFYFRDGKPFDQAELMTTTLQEWSVVDMETREAD